MKLRHEIINRENYGLAWSFHVSPSSCNNPEYYSRFIQLSAMTDKKTGQALTHLLIDEETGMLAGYVALRATSLISTSADGIPLVHPAVEIAELAVDERYERKGVGTELVNIALAVADLLGDDWIAVKYVAVCADPEAVQFYINQGFDKLASLYEIPRDGWNDNCEPMYIMLPEE